MIKRWHVMCWTASGAGWSVLAYVASSVEAGLAAILCIAVAVLMNEFVD